MGKCNLYRRDNQYIDHVYKRKRRETEININDPDVQQAIAGLPEGLGSMIRIMADSEGFLPRTGLAGSLAALSKPPTEPRSENPEPVVIDGVDTLATPTAIAEAKKAGKTVRVYRAPTTSGQPDATGLNPRQSVNLNSVINKYTTNDVIKQAEQGRTISSIADGVIANPNDATKQFSALYILVKNLDPTSAVREGELSLANGTQSYFQQWGNTLERVKAGRVISPDAAVALAQATKESLGTGMKLRPGSVSSSKLRLVCLGLVLSSASTSATSSPRSVARKLRANSPVVPMAN